MSGKIGTTNSKYSKHEHIGSKYGKLTVIGIVPPTKKGRGYLWKCQCECGNETISAPLKLINGKTKSCGCAKRERIKADPLFDRTKHGGKNERLYRIWRGMKQRCENKENRDFKNYGGRGITVCNEWKNDYAVFRKWALDNGYLDDLTIERKDVDKGYCPENCTWIPAKMQAKNRQTSKWVEYNGERRIVSEWAEIYGIEPCTIYNRLRLGWSFEKAVSVPVKHKRSAEVFARPF